MTRIEFVWVLIGVTEDGQREGMLGDDGGPLVFPDSVPLERLQTLTARHPLPPGSTATWVKFAGRVDVAIAAAPDRRGVM